MDANEGRFDGSKRPFSCLNETNPPHHTTSSLSFARYYLSITSEKLGIFPIYQLTPYPDNASCGSPVHGTNSKEGQDKRKGRQEAAAGSQYHISNGHRDYVVHRTENGSQRGGVSKELSAPFFLADRYLPPSNNTHHIYSDQIVCAQRKHHYRQ